GCSGCTQACPLGSDTYLDRSPQAFPEDLSHFETIPTSESKCTQARPRRISCLEKMVLSGLRRDAPQESYTLSSDMLDSSEQSYKCLRTSLSRRALWVPHTGRKEGVSS